MKFKVGDKVRSKYGNGEIVFIVTDFDGYHLVKLKGFDGHTGSSGYVYGYVNEDGLDDKWWFLEHQLELIKKGEI